MARIRRNVRVGEANAVPPRGFGCIHSRVHFVQEFFERFARPNFRSDAHPYS
jgi:hypothetical protein